MTAEQQNGHAGVASGWRNRIVGTGEEAPDQLLAHPFNPKVHSRAQQEAMASVLDQIGLISRVIVNRTTGHVIDGHMRVALALSRGEPAVPVDYVALSDEEELLALATFDPLGTLAGTDHAILNDLVRDVQARTPLVGDDGTLADFLAGLERTTRAASATLFLQPALNSVADAPDDGESFRPEPRPLEDPAGLFVQVTFAVTPDERATILGALRRVKEQENLDTSNAALLHLCSLVPGGSGA